MNEEEYKVVEAMENHGGGFVSALAACFRRADRDNFIRLKYAFIEYWTEYEIMSKK